MRGRIGHSFFEITTLPGCSQVGVNHSVFIPPNDRGKGYSYQDGKASLKFFKEMLGYDYVLCTVDMENEPQLKQLKKNGWKHLDTFYSYKTEHTVGIFGKVLAGGYAARED